MPQDRPRFTPPQEAGQSSPPQARAPRSAARRDQGSLSGKRLPSATQAALGGTRSKSGRQLALLVSPPIFADVLAALPDFTRPDLHPLLAKRLSQADLRIAWLMVAGHDYKSALAYSKRRSPSALGREARKPCPPPIRDAVEYLTRKVAEACGYSRQWVVQELVALYRAASRSVPVLSRGEPTGQYRFDGATATRCLELLGNQAGMFGHRVVHDVAEDVRELMRQVAERGKASGPDGRAPARLIDVPAVDVLDGGS